MVAQFNLTTLARYAIQHWTIDIVANNESS